MAHFGVGNACQFFTSSAPSYIALLAAVKEALWHAVTGCVRADDPVARTFPLVLVSLGHARFGT